MRRLRAVFRRRAREREMREEMDAHLARAAERLSERGLSPEAARLEARREFGNVGVLQEEARDIRGARWIESLIGDVRFALRHFSRRPLHVLTIVCVLSLGLGGHAAVFSLMQAIVFRPAPGVPDDESLVQIRGKAREATETKWSRRGISYPEWRTLSELRETFSSVAAARTEDVVLRVGTAEIGGAIAHFISDNYFSTLGISLPIGAGLPPTNGVAAPEAAAIISDFLWRQSYGGTTDVIGKTIDVNGIRATIVGVAPKKFHGALPTAASNVVWMSLPALPTVMRRSVAALTSNESPWLDAFGRLATGASPERATAAVRVVSNRAIAERARPATPMVYDTDVATMISGNVLPANDNAMMIVTIFETIATLVLLITCTNVSALVVGAAVARSHEIAVRLSLGASRQRVVRQLVTENTLLAFGGGSLGLVLCWLFVSLVGQQVPELELALDWKTMAFTAAIALGTGILFGLSPALNATRRGVAEVLKNTGTGHSGRARLQRVFVVAQIALTQPLLVGLAMLLGFVPHAKTMSNGVDQRLILLNVDLRSSGGNQAALRLIDRLRAIPGVASVLPDAVYARKSTLTVHADDRGSSSAGAEPVNLFVVGARPGYFELADVPIVRGRELVATDAEWSSVVIGSDVARRLWGGSDPIGKRFQVPEGRDLARELVVVGVYDAQYETTRVGENQLFVMQDDSTVRGLLIRTAGAAAPLVDSVRAVVRASWPAAPLWALGTLASMREANRHEAMLVSSATAGAGLLVLLLASLALYGVVALAVGQRRREIGIRMALGARASQVVGMLFGGGLRTSAVGLLIGLPLSIVVLSRLVAMTRPMEQVNMVFIGSAIALAVLSVASLATWIPARRAATINPVSALRAE